jgi:hypothetical protein
VTAVNVTDELARIGSVLVDDVQLRRLIKAQLGPASGRGLRVPHHHCFVCGKDALERGRHVATADLAALPERVLVVAGDRAAVAAGDTEAWLQLWRRAFHARVHLALDEKVAQGTLTAAASAERIEQIGQAEFDEARWVLREETLLIRPGDDLEEYIEFAALYLELRHFAPHALDQTFPAIADQARVDAVLARDVDALALVAAVRPVHAPEHPAPVVSGIPEPSASVSISRAVTLENAVAAARRASTRARARGNLARAAILSARAGDEASARVQLELLVERLARVLHLEGPRLPAGWVDALLPVAVFAGTQESLRFNVGMRLLADLQAGCTLAEREVKVVDFVSWARSLGRRPIVRPLPATREVRMAKRLHKASGRVPACELETAADRERLAEVLHEITAHADANVRAALRPKVEAALDAVGLEPHSLPERVAQKKLVDELLDRGVDVGRLTLGDLRDSISKNDLKLPDLTVEALRSGDQLLRADRVLEGSLDGVYRSGEVYLRFLQKLSSILFGTKVGRFATRFALLPLLGAFAVVEGLQHMIGPIAHKITGHEPHIATPVTLYGTAAFLFLVIHIAVFRGAVLFVLRWFWRGVRLVLFDAPLALWRLPLVRRIVDSRFNRWIVRPAIPAAIVALWIVDHGRLRWPIAAAVFVASALLFNSRLGRTVEERTADWVIQSSQQFTTRFLPGLVRYVLDLFARLADLVDRAMYRVDELLRYRSGQSNVKLVLKGVLSVFWSVIAYVLRLYVDLFIEPTTNPIKHFPVVTVAAKILIPFTPAILSGVAGPASKLLGSAIGNSFAAFTVIVIPGLAGFLVWELKENWKLYKAARAKTLGPISIGQHGETMVGFLKPGFHSGTIPKLFTKLRRASWRGDLRAIAKQHEGLHHVENAIAKFVDRQLVSMLVEVGAFRARDVSLVRIDVGSNRVQIAIACPSLSPDHAVLRFELQSGWIVAGIAAPGWTAHLDDAQQRIFEFALAGFYKLSGAALLREQLSRALTDGAAAPPPYDIADEGLVVWPDGFAAQLVYDLHASTLVPRVRGAAYSGPLIDLGGRHALFGREPLYWTVWSTVWQQIQRGEHPMRVVVGPSLLPISAAPAPG